MQSNDAHFDIVLRGYDRDQVDERVKFLSDELATAEQALTAARERSDGLEEELSSARSELERRVPDPDVGFGERVEKILRLAEEEAAEIRQRASTEAEEVRRRADEEATSIVEAARAEAERLVDDATATAQRRTQEGEQELERLAAVREDVQKRLRNTKKVLDEQIDPAWQADE